MTSFSHLLTFILLFKFCAALCFFNARNLHQLAGHYQIRSKAHQELFKCGVQLARQANILQMNLYFIQKFPEFRDEVTSITDNLLTNSKLDRQLKKKCSIPKLGKISLHKQSNKNLKNHMPNWVIKLEEN